MLHANSAVAVKASRAPKLRYMDLSLELIASVRSSEFSHSGSGREAVGGCDGAAAAASAAEGVLETPRTRVARQRRGARSIERAIHSSVKVAILCISSISVRTSQYGLVVRDNDCRHRLHPATSVVGDEKKNY